MKLLKSISLVVAMLFVGAVSPQAFADNRYKQCVNICSSLPGTNIPSLKEVYIKACASGCKCMRKMKGIQYCRDEGAKYCVGMKSEDPVVRELARDACVDGLLNYLKANK